MQSPEDDSERLFDDIEAVLELTKFDGGNVGYSFLNNHRLTANEAVFGKRWEPVPNPLEHWEFSRKILADSRAAEVKLVPAKRVAYGRGRPNDKTRKSTLGIKWDRNNESSILGDICNTVGTGHHFRFGPSSMREQARTARSDTDIRSQSSGAQTSAQDSLSEPSTEDAPIGLDSISAMLL